ncbi:MAG: sugar-transfer associated ATP-grasp domain-containing protein [Bacteroidales bacterium]
MSRPMQKSKIKLFLEVLSDPERKSIFKIFKEIIQLMSMHKEFPVHYFTSYLFKSDIIEVENYLPAKLTEKIAPSLNDKRLKEVLDNKLYFYLFYRQFNIKTPRVLMFNHGENFYKNNEVFNVKSSDDFLKQMKALFEVNPSSNSVFVKKIYSSSKGSDIYRIDARQVETNHQSIHDLFKRIIQSEFIFQENVIQHPSVDILNPSSVNTIRMDTFIDAFGKAHVISGYIRMSTGNTFVDNISSGGCMVGVDLESGKLKRYGYTNFHVNPTERLTRHPLTKIVFEGFQIPFLNEAKELIVKSALLMPGLRLVGWDVAIGVDGPVIIEGNFDYGIRGNDLNYGGYIAHPVFGKVLKELGLMYS